MGYGRTKPDTQEGELFGGNTWNTIEKGSNMVLAVPLGQVVQVLLNGIVGNDIFGVDILHNVGLRVLITTDCLALGLEDDAVQGQLRKRTE